MNKKSILLNNNINIQNLKGYKIKDLSKNFDRIFSEVKNEIKNTNKTLNVLDRNFIFNIKIKNLKRFKKFKTIVLIGMGGSILGAEAIYNFFQEKIKKN